MPQVQVLLPGNFQGQTVKINSDLSVKATDAWKGPALSEALRADGKFDTIVVGAGNNSSVFSEMSYLDNGTIERNLLKHHKPDATMISAADLEFFNNKRLAPLVANSIWTNIKYNSTPYPFKSYYSTTSSNRKIRVFNFIGANKCKNITPGSWGDFEVESPERTIRRLDIDFDKNDIAIITVELDELELRSLVNQLKRESGTFVVLDYKYDNTSYLLKRDQNVYRASIRPGYKRLTRVEVNFRTWSEPRITLRALPYSQADIKNKQQLFAKEKPRLQKILREPLKIINTELQASTSVFNFKAKTLAKLIKMHTNADISFVERPQMNFLNDNIIRTGNLVLMNSNDRVRIIRIPGSRLPKVLEGIFQQRGKRDIALYGVEFSLFGTRANEIRVNGVPANQHRDYRLAITDQTLKDSNYKKLFEDMTFESYYGITKWNVWQKQLPFVEITDEMLYN